MSKYMKLEEFKGRCSYYILKKAVLAVSWDFMFKCSKVRVYGIQDAYLVKESQEEIIKMLEEVDEK